MISTKLYGALVVFERDSNEYVLAQYLVNHQDEIEKIKMADILKETGLSKSTASRVFKKFGYNSYSAIQYLLSKENSNQLLKFKNRIVPINIKEKIKDIKRIILLGDIYSLSPLIVYKKMFGDINITFDILFTFQNYSDILKKEKLKKDDLIIFVSLYEATLDLMADYSNGYIDLVDYIKKEDLNYLYIGKVSNTYKSSGTFHLIEEQINNSEAIYQLCYLFESIYNELYQRFKK